MTRTLTMKTSLKNDFLFVVYSVKFTFSTEGCLWFYWTIVLFWPLKVEISKEMHGPKSLASTLFLSEMKREQCINLKLCILRKLCCLLKSNSVQQCILQRLVFWRIGLTWFLRISQRKIIYKYAHLNFSPQMGPIGHKMTHHGLTMRESPKMFFFRKNYKIGDPPPIPYNWA